MAVDIQLRGFDQLERRLRALPDKIERGVMRKTLRASANKVRRRLAAGTPVFSGAAKRSVKVKKVRSSNNVAYAVIGYSRRSLLTTRMRERGGRQGKQPARPFFEAAVSGFQDEVMADFRESLKAAVEKAEG